MWIKTAKGFEVIHLYKLTGILKWINFQGQKK